MNFFRQVEAGGFEHGGPEQCMEVGDVLADEVMHFGFGILPPAVEVFPVLFTPFESRSDITDGCIKPDVPVITGAVGNFKTEVGCGARDIPVAERVSQEMPFEIVGDFRLQMLAGLRPLFQKCVQVFDADKQMIGGADFRRRIGKRADRIGQVGRCVSAAAFVAVIAVLIGGITFRAGPFDEAVGEKRVFLHVE